MVAVEVGSPFQPTRIHLGEAQEGERHLGHRFLCVFPKLFRNL